MSDAAKLASRAFGSRPSGTSYAKYMASSHDIANITSKVQDAIIESAYSSAISYSEALSGLRSGSCSWGIIRLYYSSFYSIRSLLFANAVVPFHCGAEMILDLGSGKFLKGGKSSHHWNWNSIRALLVKSEWFGSQDSEEAYNNVRLHRENVNYTHGFTDPNWHSCLVSGEMDLGKRIRTYRDDASFTYTYLPDHLVLSYPTKLIFYLDSVLNGAGISLSADQIAHASKIWPLKDRCPFT